MSTRWSASVTPVPEGSSFLPDSDRRALRAVAPVKANIAPFDALHAAVTLSTSLVHDRTGSRLTHLAADRNGTHLNQQCQGTVLVECGLHARQPLMRRSLHQHHRVGHTLPLSRDARDMLHQQSQLSSGQTGRHRELRPNRRDRPGHGTTSESHLDASKARTSGGSSRLRNTSQRRSCRCIINARRAPGAECSGHTG